MSFSGDVKEELTKHLGTARHCQLAELAGLLVCCGQVHGQVGESLTLSLRTENPLVESKCRMLLKKLFQVGEDLPRQEDPEGSEAGNILFCDGREELILDACKWRGEDGGFDKEPATVSGMLLRNACCKRAFLRGVFLAIGSMSDPKKNYHLEFVCSTEELAQQICRIIGDFELEAKITLRKKYYVVYMKEGGAIVDLLNVMEAHAALLELEELRVFKEIGNRVNRQCNCETANLAKTVGAANRQMEDIRLIRDRKGLDFLPPGLREAAILRLENEDATLSELAQRMDPPIGKSGMNHRLRKLSEIAEQLREE